MSFFHILIWMMGLFLGQPNSPKSEKQINIDLNLTADTIPFTLTEHNNISVNAIINDVDTVSLMFHTAANDVTLIEEAVKKLTSIKTDGVESVNSWGGDQSSKYSVKNKIQIGQKIANDLTIWENKNSGPGTDGKFGLSFFQDQIVEIDFDKKYLLVYETVDEAEITKDGYERFTLKGENGLYFLKGKSRVGDVWIENDLLIHTGYGGAILYDDETSAKTGLSENLTIIDESELKDSYGNIIKTKKALLTEFKIGNHSLTDMPVGFFEGSIGRQKMSVMGGDLVKRFNVIFDINHMLIYLKPNQQLNSPFSTS